MKRKRNQWLKCFNYLLSGVLLLLGFSSCFEEGDGMEPSLEYGVRYARYSIKGKVVNEEKEAIPDIQLIVKGLLRTTTYSEYQYSIDTLYSDTQGEFVFEDAYASPDLKYRIIHKNVDKDGNVKPYKTDSTSVDITDPTSVIGNWQDGQVEVEIVVEEKAGKESN